MDITDDLLKQIPTLVTIPRELNIKYSIFLHDIIDDLENGRRLPW